MVNSGTNWAKNLTYRAQRLHSPRSVAEVQEIVAGAARVKALGSRHCFNDIADTTSDHVSLAELPADVVIEDDVVWVGGGMRCGDLADQLAEHGRALHNTASLPHITVVGATATGTHGSGVGNASLSAAVVGLEIVRADGELVRLSPQDPDFDGAVVHLGALGVVTRIGLRVQPTFEVATTVHLGLDLDGLLANYPAIARSAYSLSVFTDWRDNVQIWAKSRVGDPVTTDFFGATPAEVPTHMLAGQPIDNLTEQLGVPGPWHQRLPHFRPDFTPSNGDELQSEYFVAAEHAPQALAALRPLGERMAGLLLTNEIRTIAADDLWLGPTQGADSVALHFTWAPDQEAVEALLPEIEAALRPFDARPHWGKVFTTEPSELRRIYPRLDDFAKLVRRFDPDGKFANDYTARILGGP
ncbi:D-arabinono-1,4-lactone oxidase [Saccharopolyspora griseoalba]|uniref:D-arabinono-1,4-lactone oxidase n=1 Tax=Saccharopolyspora griseoalba TaxID=1431848 RepID=A0ABW2LHY1_9PSEU